MAKQWILPKPEWKATPFSYNCVQLGVGDIAAQQWNIEGVFYARFNWDTKTFATQSEARAYAEQRVMEALNAREIEG